MMPPSFNGAYSDDSSQILCEDGDRVFRRGWRLDDNGEQRVAMIVLSAAEHPSRRASIALPTSTNLRMSSMATEIPQWSRLLAAPCRCYSFGRRG